MFENLTGTFCEEINILLRDLTDDIVCFFDSDGNILAANKSFEDIFLRSGQELTSFKIYNFLHESYRDELELPAEGEHVRQSLKFISSDGHPYFSESIIFCRDEKYLFLGKSKSATHEEALKEISKLNNELANKTRELSKRNSELKGARAEMERIIRTDELTELANRRAFMEFAERILAQSRRHDRDISLVIMDIDDFKNINDTYGHKMGDEVLRRLGEVLLENVRKGDMVARIGGEEFAMLLVEAGAEESEKFAERIRQKIKNMELDTLGFDHTVSLGVTQFREEDSIEDLMERADRAMYRAKEAGKDMVKTI